MFRVRVRIRVRVRVRVIFHIISCVHQFNYSIYTLCLGLWLGLGLGLGLVLYFTSLATCINLIIPFIQYVYG